MSWDVAPEPPDPQERAALLQVAAKELERDQAESAWWRSGFDDLGGGPAPKHAWRRTGVVEP